MSADNIIKVLQIMFLAVLFVAVCQHIYVQHEAVTVLKSAADRMAKAVEDYE